MEKKSGPESTARCARVQSKYFCCIQSFFYVKYLQNKHFLQGIGVVSRGFSAQQRRAPVGGVLQQRRVRSRHRVRMLSPDCFMCFFSVSLLYKSPPLLFNRLLLDIFFAENACVGRLSKAWLVSAIGASMTATAAASVCHRRFSPN